MVSIDLKERNGRLILYIIDVVTRYTRAIFIKSKKKEVIVDMIIQLWMSIFGAANMFLMDNDSEFANDELRELGNQFGINIKHTAAYAPWANGINERNHSSIDIMIRMEKMLEDLPQLSEETALQYAVSIRNCSMYAHGFTPAQLAIGQNPRLPSALSDGLPALEGETTSPVIAEHLNTIASARRAFASAQTSAKLKRALRKPIRSYCDAIYNHGGNVFHKLPDQRRWQGPAAVIGCDGKVVLIRHGSIYRRVHPCRLQHVKADYVSDDVNKVDVNDSPNSRGKISDLEQDAELGQDISITESSTEAQNDSAIEAQNDSAIETQNDSARPVPSCTNHADNTGSKSAGKIVLPKKNQSVMFKYPDSDWKKIKVTGRAGKATGKASNWLNVSDGEASWSLDWSDVDEWKVVDESDTDREESRKESREELSGHEGPRGVKCSSIEGNDGAGCVRAIVNQHQSINGAADAVSDNDNCDISVMPENEVFVGCPESDEYFNAAKLDELKKWEQFEVYDEVKDVGQKYLTGRWVCTEKVTDEGRIPKARFVVRGFQEKTNIQADSPTGSKECMRIVLMIVATNGWTLHAIDVKSAFLQDKQINRTLYSKPPPDSGNLRQGSRIHCLEKCCFLKDVNYSSHCSEIWPTN